MEGRTEGWKDRQTLFYRTLQAEAGGQMNVWMVNHLVLTICYFGLCKKCLQNFCLLKKWMIWKSSIRMLLNLWHCHTTWYLIAGFKSTIILCFLFSLYDLSNMCFLLKYLSWKLQLKSRNTNHESLHQTLFEKNNWKVCCKW